MNTLILIPVTVFIVALLATLWLSRTAFKYLAKRYSGARWSVDRVLRTVRVPVILWCLTFSAYLALAVYRVPPVWEDLVAKTLWTLFSLSVFLGISNFVFGQGISWVQRRRLPELIIRVIAVGATAVLLFFAVLVLLYIWERPGNPLSAALDWLKVNWLAVLVPLAVFAVALVVLLWLRRFAYKRLKGWLSRIGGEEERILVQAIKGPSVLLVFIISIYIAVVVSAAPPEWKSSTGRGLWTLFMASLTVSVLSVVNGFLTVYGDKWNLPRDTVLVLRNTIRIVFLIVVVLAVLEMWGIPTSPILILIIVLALGAALAFRDVIPNLFAGLQLSATRQVKVGDYIKLETGEEGYVLEVGWNNTHIKSQDESVVIVPNSKLLRHTVVKYGRHLRRASQPFRFNTRTHITELTGLKARNLREMADILRKAPDAIVYYHTHRFLEERHYLTPEPSNDFAVWVSDALGDEMLGEALASVDTFAFPSLAALRDRLVVIIDEHIARGSDDRPAVEGAEFYFMKSVSVLLPTPYMAYDLKEFAEALRIISLGALYFHMFEARLRLGREELNDFSLWLENGLGETELGKEIARIDPYTYTLEGLRLALLQTVEKNVK